MSNVLYGAPICTSRITLDEIPTDPIIERIRRLALVRKEELQTIIQYGNLQDDVVKDFKRELETIQNILSNVETFKG